MPNRTSQRGLAEVFGHPVDEDSDQARLDRQAHRCPFLRQTCWKQSRLIDYPFGVCSVKYDGDTIVTCPSRFRQDQRVFKDIADHYFGTRHDLVLFSGIKVSAATHSGRRIEHTFDHVLVKHKPLSSEIEDFVVVEVQTVGLTNTGKLVASLNDYMGGQDARPASDGFGLSWATVGEHWFPQILRKSAILERWGHPIYWVAQERAYQCLLDSNGLQGMALNQAHATVFMAYDVVAGEQGNALVCTRRESAIVDQLFDRFVHNAPIPSRDDFVGTLRQRMRAMARKSVRLESETT